MKHGNQNKTQAQCLHNSVNQKKGSVGQNCIVDSLAPEKGVANTSCLQRREYNDLSAKTDGRSLDYLGT